MLLKSSPHVVFIDLSCFRFSLFMAPWLGNEVEVYWLQSSQDMPIVFTTPASVLAATLRVGAAINLAIMM
jgi:hypothetical protein